MLRTDTAVTIYRKDYAAPAFRIDEVALEIDLVPERTRVVNRLRMTRTAAAKPLVLVGEGLELAGATIDGKAVSGLQADGDTLTIDAVPAEAGASFTLELTTFCNPAANSSLMGLYVSNGNFFTQCEAEGFRKITYFLDRPDVMTVYTVTLRASKVDYPATCRTAAMKPCGTTRSRSRRTCSRWWRASWNALKSASSLPPARRSCCRCGWKRKTSAKRATRWTRSSTRSTGTSAASGWSWIWTAS